MCEMAKKNKDRLVPAFVVKNVPILVRKGTGWQPELIRFQLRWVASL
jgi:hypothetical protein